jgi:lipoic acid synthetase
MHTKKPDWLRIKAQTGKNRAVVEDVLQRLSLHTVCEQAGCPNLMECFCSKTATFMILGKVCTRNCTFCQVLKGCPDTVSSIEPVHVSQAVKELDLKHVVITSVTRDDLDDGGAGHFAEVIRQIKALKMNVTIEVLIPDFQGDMLALQKVIDAVPDVINHNIETVPRLYPNVRPMADYSRSLALLQNVKNSAPDINTKSGIMVGLGETQEEVIQSMQELRDTGCDFLTIGQYLAPSKQHHPVIEYIHPSIFDNYKALALEMGFSHVASGPFVRSSYHAAQALSQGDDDVI